MAGGRCRLAERAGGAASSSQLPAHDIRAACDGQPVGWGVPQRVIDITSPPAPAYAAADGRTPLHSPPLRHRGHGLCHLGPCRAPETSPLSGETVKWSRRSGNQVKPPWKMPRCHVGRQRELCPRPRLWGGGGPGSISHQPEPQRGSQHVDCIFVPLDSARALDQELPPADQLTNPH